MGSSRPRRVETAPESPIRVLEEVLELTMPAERARLTARALLKRYRSLGELAAAPRQELLSSGLSQSTIAKLLLMKRTAMALMRNEVSQKPVLSQWEDLMGYLYASLAHERVEHFRVLHLDNRNRLISDELQGIGTTDHVLVYPREVVKRALDLSASALILVHNHPGGDSTPSVADIQMTAEIIAAARTLSIRFIDHIIVSEGGWLSFRREGLVV